MLKSKKILIVLIAGITLGMVSCKKFMDVNKNPNVSPNATLKVLLPAAQLYLASGVGVDLQIYGAFWAQYWTQAPVGTTLSTSYYTSLDQYSPVQDFFNNSWANLYAANENFYQLQNLADSQNAKQYAAIALLMQAYTFQILSDAWGDVPFKQALKGQYLNGHLVNPKYDSQLVVYKGILAYIDTAIKYIDSNASVAPGTDDLVYQGDMNKWKKFAYTLKLRAILRMSEVNPASSMAALTALYNTSGLSFIGIGDDAYIKFGFGAGNGNPLYSEQLGIGYQNIAGSRTCIDSMINNYDTARLKVFYEAGSSGSYSGVTQGDYLSTYSSFSIPNVYVAGDMKKTASANAQVNLLTSYESLFLQAEVVARGWVIPGPSDGSLFLDAIKANFEFYNSQILAATGVIADTAYNRYLAGNGSATQYPGAGTVNQKLRYIMLQKWYAMCGNQSFEAWTELRRTGLDSILKPSVNGSIGMQLPKRFLYPTTESRSNSNFPGLKTVSTKVWWDMY